MNQFQANLGDSVVLTQNNRVTNQYGADGAEGSFASVFDSPRDQGNSQLQCYNFMTSIGRYNTDGEAPDSHLAILGLIEYGIGGVQFKANFDWKVGTQFSIAASFVRLSAAFSEVGETAPSEILVAAMMASGSRAARSQVTRSYPQLTVVDGGNSTVLFPVPPLAHALNLFSPQPKFYEAGSVVIRYVGGANQGISTASTSLAVFETDGVPFLSAMSNEDGMRFPETARWVEVSYGTSEVVEFEFTPCFTLSL